MKTYDAQIRTNGSDWRLVAIGRDASEAAWKLTDDMSRAGFRYNELAAHREDLVAGHVLTSETGIAFRVISTESVRTAAPRCEIHPAFEAEYCPSCGTSRRIGEQSDSRVALMEHGLGAIAHAVGGSVDPHGLIDVSGSEWFSTILVDLDVSEYRIGLYETRETDRIACMVHASTVDEAIAAVHTLRRVVLTSASGEGI